MINHNFTSVLIFILGFGYGCSSIGPGRLESDRTAYNQAIQQSSDQQLLLNLVRLKYRDTPFFMEVNSVTSQFTFTTDADASASIPEGLGSTFGLGAGVSVQEKPTVSYTPLQGDEFIQRVLAPITLETLALLYNSGWRVDRLFRLCVQRLNHTKNAPRATGPTPDTEPEFREFLQLVRILSRFQGQAVMDINFMNKNGLPILVLQFEPEALNWPEMAQLSTILGVSARDGRFYLAPSNAPEYVRIQTRSLLGTLYYLSQGVEVPERDRKAGKVTLTRAASGDLFDWKELTRDLLRIQSKSSRPAGASVGVRYRGEWFYIDDADLNSKSTFSLLAQIFSLQAGKISGSAPVLTLGIGQ